MKAHILHWNTDVQKSLLETRCIRGGYRFAFVALDLNMSVIRYVMSHWSLLHTFQFQTGDYGQGNISQLKPSNVLPFIRMYWKHTHLPQCTSRDWLKC